MFWRKKGCLVGLVLCCTGFAFAADTLMSAKSQQVGSKDPTATPVLQKSKLDFSPVNAAPAAPEVPLSASDRQSMGLQAGNGPVTRGNVSPLANLGGPADQGQYRTGTCDGDVIYTNGDVNGVNGLVNQRQTGDGTYDAWCADEAQISSDTLVGAIVWFQLMSSSWGFTGTGDYQILADNGGAPDEGNILAAANDVPLCSVDTGLNYFGYPVIEMTAYVNVTFPAGAWYVAARPVGSAGPSPFSYWATANDVGDPSYFKAPVWTGDVWQQSYGQFGQYLGFAFCLIGPFEGGACCLKGDCFETSKDDCTRQGGTYMGDGTPCCATICPGRAAGCCFEDGTCQDLKPADCDAAGGKYQGEANLCKPGLCPLPDFCADAFYKSDYNANIGAYWNMRTTDGALTYDGLGADDVTLFPQNTVLTGLYWSQADYPGFNWDGNVDYYLWNPDGASYSPGSAFIANEGVAAQRFDTGNKQFGFYPIDVYALSSLSDNVPAGTYYFSMRPNAPYYQLPSYWMMNDAVQGNPAWYNPPFDGVDNWVKTSSYMGQKLDWSFCAVGKAEGDITGACCLDGDCTQVTKANCRGEFLGEYTTCVPNKCPGAPGACCFADFSCQELKPAECESAGGTFLGSGTGCEPNPCASLACIGALYDNGTLDGVNGYVDFRNGAGQDAFIADDGGFDQTVTVMDFHFIHLTTSYYGEWQKIGDFIVLTGNNGYPETYVTEIYDYPMDRVFLGFTLFGYNVYLYNVEGLNIQLGAGTYFFGGRPVLPSSDWGYWATAAAKGNSGYLKAPQWGYPDWTAIGYDFAFCVTGEVGESKFGGCCLDQQGTCELTTRDKCKGEFQGEGTSCYPNICPGSPGACCLDGVCYFVSRDECAGINGDYQGEGVRCKAGLCPIPDFCADAFYRQDYNPNIGALWNMRVTDGSGFINGLGADDILLTYQNTILTGLYWYQADYPGFNFDGNGDRYVWYPDGPGNSPGTALITVEGTPIGQIDTGNKQFGFYPIILYTMGGLSDNIPAGSWLFSMRPNAPFYQLPSYWMTTDSVIDNQAWFMSEYFTGGAWVKISTQLGSPADYSFCATGTFEGEQTGACCLDGDCTQVIESECQGQFQGGGTDCVPNTCPGAPGACCFDDFSCQELKEGPCKEAGGTFLGSGIFCDPSPCAALACVDAVYDNGTQDGVNGLTSERDQAIESWTADDGVIDAPTTMLDFHFIAITGSGYGFNDTGDVIVLTGDSGFPDVEVGSVSDWPMTAASLGFTLFGYPAYLYNVVDLAIDLPAGTYFFGARPVGTNSYGRNFWATAPSKGANSYIKSVFFGYPDWTDWANLGIIADVAFCVTGVPAGGDFGACCAEDSTCKVTSPEKCAGSGGEYLGNGTKCKPNPCPDAPGACCFEDGSCQFLQESKCAAAKGVFQGIDVKCGPGVCPIPDFCAESFYNNGAYDGVNGYAAQDDDSIGMDVYVADDVTLDATQALGAVAWLTVDDAGLDWSGNVNLYVFPDDGGIPAMDPAYDVQDAAAVRINTGNIVFGRPLMQYYLSGLSFTMNSGTTYWVAPQTHSTNFGGQSFILTSPVTGSDVYCAYDWFGYPKWTKGSDVFGSEANINFCLLSGAPCAGVVRGDSNGDGLVDFDDIDCFVAALIGEGNWEDCGTAYGPGDYVCANDVNQDGSVDFNDIDGFVTCIINGGCP